MAPGYLVCVFLHYTAYTCWQNNGIIWNIAILFYVISTALSSGSTTRCRLGFTVQLRAHTGKMGLFQALEYRQRTGTGICNQHNDTLPKLYCMHFLPLLCFHDYQIPMRHELLSEKHFLLSVLYDLLTMASVFACYIELLYYYTSEELPLTYIHSCQTWTRKGWLTQGQLCYEGPVAQIGGQASLLLGHQMPPLSREENLNVCNLEGTIYAGSNEWYCRGTEIGYL